MTARKETTVQQLTQQGTTVLPALPALVAGEAPAAQAALIWGTRLRQTQTR
jgi:hypothetical protein